jgi:hypothetical protein
MFNFARIFKLSHYSNQFIIIFKVVNNLPHKFIIKVIETIDAKQANLEDDHHQLDKKATKEWYLFVDDSSKIHSKESPNKRATREWILEDSNEKRGTRKWNIKRVKPILGKHKVAAPWNRSKPRKYRF